MASNGHQMCVEPNWTIPFIIVILWGVYFVSWINVTTSISSSFNSLVHFLGITKLGVRAVGCKIHFSHLVVFGTKVVSGLDLNPWPQRHLQLDVCSLKYGCSNQSTALLEWAQKFPKIKRKKKKLFVYQSEKNCFIFGWIVADLCVSIVKIWNHRRKLAEKQSGLWNISHQCCYCVKTAAPLSLPRSGSWLVSYIS